MPTIIGYHSVKDTDHWLASPKREEVFGPLGVSNIRTFVDPQDRTRVAVLMDVADMDALMGAMQSEAGAQAMEHDGVLPETMVILVEAQSRPYIEVCRSQRFATREATPNSAIYDTLPRDCPVHRSRIVEKDPKEESQLTGATDAHF
jgi:hypothetical protein